MISDPGDGPHLYISGGTALICLAGTLLRAVVPFTGARGGHWHDRGPAISELLGTVLVARPSPRCGSAVAGNCTIGRVTSLRRILLLPCIIGDQPSSGAHARRSMVLVAGGILGMGGARGPSGRCQGFRLARGITGLSLLAAWHASLRQTIYHEVGPVGVLACAQARRRPLASRLSLFPLLFLRARCANVFPSHFCSFIFFRALRQ